MNQVKLHTSSLAHRNLEVPRLQKGKLKLEIRPYDGNETNLWDP
jgi:hypothetical protein